MSEPGPIQCRQTWKNTQERERARRLYGDHDATLGEFSHILIFVTAIYVSNFKISIWVIPMKYTVEKNVNDDAYVVLSGNPLS